LSKKPETKLSEDTQDRLNAEDGWWFKVHGSPFQKAGVPDIIGCYRGLFVAIELKMPGNGPSELQKHILDLLTKAGARCGVAYTIKEALQIRNGELNWSQQKIKLELTNK
jgi:Holliday junction resolvase